MAPIDWDDLRYVLAVASAGSVAGAARNLGVNHTTVLRRVGSFEKELGVRLFDRLATGYVLTAGGEELVDVARQIADRVATLERQVAGRDWRLSGVLRVTTTDTLAGSILPEILAEFRAKYPGVQLEIATSNLMFDLSRRDADVAIRPTSNPPETLVGRRVSKVSFGVYGSPRYLSENQEKSLREHSWVVPDDSLADAAVSRWTKANLAESEITLRADSLLVLSRAARAGLGLAALPCYLGDTTPGLVRIRPIPEVESALWILTHEDLRETARVRAFTEFAADAFGRRRAVLEGSAASSIVDRSA